METWAVAAYTIFVFILGFMFGKHWHDTKEQLDMLREKLANYQPKDETPEPPKSMIVEPLSPEQQAAKDMQERIKRVNG